MTVDEAIEYVRKTQFRGTASCVLADAVVQLRAEADRIKYGFCNGFCTVYGTERAIQLTTEWYTELLEYRRKEAREEELAALKAENERLKRLCREQLIDVNDEGPELK